MKHNLEQLAQFKSVKLSEEERGRIRAHIAHLMSTSPLPVHQQSLLQRGLHHGLRIALSSLMFFIFIGGTVSAIADNALPGDPLYSFKINVNEEVKGFFQKTPEQKVAYNAQRVENRVGEIKTLAASKTLTKAKQATVQKALDEHIKNLSENLNELSAVAPTAALDATTTLENTLKANKAALENSSASSENSDQQEAISTVDGTIQKVSNQEVKIIAKEIDTIQSDIDSTQSPSALSLQSGDITTPAEDGKGTTDTNTTTKDDASTSTSTSVELPKGIPKISVPSTPVEP